MRKNFEDSIVTPLPVLMIGTYDEEGNANVMNIAWGGQCGPKHIAINIGLPEVEKKTLKNIKVKKEFTVSYATKDTMEISDYFGLFSGNVVDKIAEAEVNVEKAENVDAPIIAEYPLTAECKLVEMNENDLGEMHIIGEIVNISADESILDDEGNISVDKLQPIVYDSIGKTYRIVGEVVGTAFEDGIKIKK
ncbi:MAG: flavin reductase family protein [Methanobrevibacter sp.]|uniref:flavin reductase family protein n=1 Tax=Methanobrevibacter sp. TaxID=66852 RepID=UPI0025CC91D1|nr:flavin reductase family protein [Methanobrevibacter sp.]MEE0935935.1 flavin reductase family protein [Methanobrevibacter sp.]